jgi:hypothetical protein
MVKKLCAMVLVAAMFVSVSVSAPVSVSNFRGAGAIDCGQWLEQRNVNHWTGPMAWVMGFISSYNYYGPESVDAFIGVSWQTLAAYLDKYCREKPLDGLAHAAISFIDQDQQHLPSIAETVGNLHTPVAP